MNAEELAAEVAAWHAARLETLQQPDGWLTLIGLEELPATGSVTAGAAGDAGVRIRADVPAHVGTFVVSADTVRFVPAPGVAVTMGEPAEPVPGGGVALATDRSGVPTELRLGSVSWFVIARGERRFVRIKDADSEVRRQFTGIERFPVDPAWRVVARLVTAGAPATIAVPNALGQVDEEPCPGYLEFEHGGQTLRLLPMGDPGGPLFIVFGDATSGQQTYGGGRFLGTEPVGEDGTVVLDFNRATNPPCVFTPYATCPLPPAGNVLPVAVTAGEKMWGAMH